MTQDIYQLILNACLKKDFNTANRLFKKAIRRKCCYNAEREEMESCIDSHRDFDQAILSLDDQMLGNLNDIAVVFRDRATELLAAAQSEDVTPDSRKRMKRIKEQIQDYDGMHRVLGEIYSERYGIAH